MRIKCAQLLCLLVTVAGYCQEKSIDFFLEQGLKHSPALEENINLQSIAGLQEQLIYSQNQAWQVSASSDVLLAPYFDSNGKAIDLTTNPSPLAIGYDIGITNGGLYSVQLNITRNIFNQASVDRLLMRNTLQKESLNLTRKELEHTLRLNIRVAYILAYQLQVQRDFTETLVGDLEKRLSVLRLLVEKGVSQESDYLLIEQELAARQLEGQQISGNLREALANLYSTCGLSAYSDSTLKPPEIELRATPEHFFFEERYANDSLILSAEQEVFENQYRPQVQVFGNTGINAVELKNIDRRVGLSAGLRLTIPIYDGHQRQNNARQTQLLAENLGYYRDNRQLQVQNRLLALNSQIMVQATSLESIDTQIEQQKKLMEIYKIKMLQGQVSVIDYLNVMQNYRLYHYTKMQSQTNLWLLQSQTNFLNW